MTRSVGDIDGDGLGDFGEGSPFVALPSGD
jgi:hypothetical protein